MWEASHTENPELTFFDLRVLQFDRGCTPKNGNRDLEARLFLVNLLYETIKRIKGTVAYTNLLAYLERH